MTIAKEDLEHVRTVQQDMYMREIIRRYPTTKAEVKEKEHAQEVWDFEHGDHLPDGTVEGRNDYYKS